MSRPLANLHIANIVAIDGEAYGCSDLVKTILAGRTRIYVQKLIHRVEDNFKYVRVPCDEDIGACALYHPYGLG